MSAPPIAAVKVTPWRSGDHRGGVSSTAFGAPRVAMIPPATPIMPNALPRRAVRWLERPARAPTQHRPDPSGVVLDRIILKGVCKRSKRNQPEMALVTDMSGECRAGLTPHTVWYPTMPARPKVVTI
ncbi:hypothetical protein EYF80_018442 [Liparis tanakae]|uniref:Uncharacterized protein n=1 Tax=Liparis tanakae TaxID=230148 RepID=A0A4Z2I243_9TELE|nr:hypothetical protein EYF80_018442 [Liparis tanakae]